MHLLRLIRWPNLIIVALTQFLLYQFVLLKNLKAENIEPVLDHQGLLLLILTTVLVTAGGYIINDIYDQVIDALNKPEKQIVGSKISERQAYQFYWITTGVATLFTLILTIRTAQWFWISGCWLAIILLWLYSRSWKKMALIGNVVVAFFCALVAYSVMVAEGSSLSKLAYQNHDRYYEVISLFYGYMLFAFLSTMYREIVKDMEDISGDEVNNCRTLPVIYGIPKTKVVAAFFAITLLLSVIYWGYLLFINSKYTHFIYLVITIMIPIKISLLLLGMAGDKMTFHRLSSLTKLIMLSGILYLIFDILVG